MEKLKKNLKMFFSSVIGRVVLTILLYGIIWGIMLGVTSALNNPAFIVVIAIVLAYFGWKSLNRITPKIFLIMPIGGWVVYCIVKGVLSFVIGTFVAPFLIAKSIVKKISEKL